VKPEKITLENKKSVKNNPVFLNLFPKCEPRLGKRKIYEEIGGVKNQDSLKQKKAIQWILNLSDGKHSLRDIQERSGLEFDMLFDMANLLENKKLLSHV
jgi:aminopeptidase-like protein